MIGARQPERLASEGFDLAVIGGGILGAFVAWHAARAGMRTALVERDDFASGTTSASGRVLHGGLRSLQHLDVRSAAESLREREILARLAPQLSRPLPFLFPVDDGLLESLLLRGAARAWNGFARFRDSGLPPARFAGSAAEIPRSLRAWAPAGGLCVYDRQIVAPERLVMAVLSAAVSEGATVCNRIEAERILTTGGQVRGLLVRDRLADRYYEVQADRVVNVGGPWAMELWPEGRDPPPPVAFARGIHVVAELSPPSVALGLPWQAQKAGARGRRARRIFVMPWAGMTLIGASWAPADAPGRWPVRPDFREVGHFVDSVSAQWPQLRLERRFVRYAVAGLYPFFGRDRVASDSYQVARTPLIWDHGARRGPRGLVTAIGVKLTTAAAVAEQIMDRYSGPSASRGRRRPTDSLGPLEFASPSSIPDLGFEPIRDPATAIRLARAGAEREQALTLEDLFLRRCVAGQFGLPAREVRDAAAAELARIHGWSVDRTAREIAEFESIFSELTSKVADSEDRS